MDKKKNYSKKAGGKGLMAAIADYQKEQKAKRKGVDKQGASAIGAAAAKGKKETRPSSVTHRKPPTAPPPVRSSTSPKKDPPRTMPSNPQLKSQPGGSGTRGRQMPSNPAVGYSKPVRRNFSSQAAFLKALETYMRRKKRGEQAARSTGKGKAKQATDGRQYGG